MFWSTISGVYDLIENVYNGKVNAAVTDYVASLMNKDDKVLECACGTGMFSVKIAPRAKELTATDFADGMLKRTQRKCRKLSNVHVEKGDITALKYGDAQFDKAVAANVIHLLDDPAKAKARREAGRSGHNPNVYTFRLEPGGSALQQGGRRL